jgi:hypothetical protein
MHLFPQATSTPPSKWIAASCPLMHSLLDPQVPNLPVLLLLPLLVVASAAL